MEEKFLIRPENWLPQSYRSKVEKEIKYEVDENDMFSKGEISRYFPYQEYGYVKDCNGKDIVFKLDEIDLVGERGYKENITIGSKVGYDLSVTSSGVRVSKLKIY